MNLLETIFVPNLSQDSSIEEKGSQSNHQLAREQRRLSRKLKASQNRGKARGKVALRYLKVQRARKHFHHEETAKPVERFDRIAVEDLNIRGMVKNRHLAKAILD